MKKKAGDIGKGRHLGRFIGGPQLTQHDLLDLRRAEARAADGFDVRTVHRSSLLSNYPGVEAP